MSAGLVTAAENLIRAGAVEQAEELLRGAAADKALSPDGAGMLARLLHNRAVACWQADDARQAEMLLSQALVHAPAQLESRQALVAILLRRAQRSQQNADLAEAAEAILHAFRLGLDAGEVAGDEISALAAWLHAHGVECVASQPVLASRLTLAAWALCPKEAGFYAVARSLFVHLGTAELGASISAAQFEEMLTADPSDVVALIGLANVERRAGKMNRAERLYRQAAGLAGPFQGFAHGRLAALLAELGRFTEADHLFQAVGAQYGGVESAIRFDSHFISALRPSVSAPVAREALPDVELVIFAGCDAGYFRRFSDAFVNSASMIGHRAAIHFHIVGPDGETAAQLDRLRLRHPSLPILASSEPVPSALSGDGLRTFYACARFLQLPALLRQYGRPLLMLDIDMVLLRDVTPLIQQLAVEQADIALTHGMPHDPWCRLWADAILCAPSEAAVSAFEMVKAYISHFLAQGRAIWFLDQVALYAVLGGTHRHQARVLPWPMDIQNGHTATSYFWSLHSSQPNNQGAEQSALYQHFAQAGGAP